MKKYTAAWFMLSLALLFAVLHFYMGWEAAIDEAQSHHESAVFRDYIVQWLRDTFENLQSEFWQLTIQFLVLAGFFSFAKIHAYEEDIQELKDTLARIEAKQ